MTPGCSSALPETQQERFRPTHTWLLPVSAQAALYFLFFSQIITAIIAQYGVLKLRMDFKKKRNNNNKKHSSVKSLSNSSCNCFYKNGKQFQPVRREKSTSNLVL